MAAIVIGYDGSDGSQATLVEAAALASRLGDRIVVVFGYAPGGYGGGEIPSHRQAVEEFGERVTGEAAERARALGVDCEVELIPLHPEHALLQAAAEHEARMIVVGTHGDSPLKGAILGSTPHKLLHLAECPVLVVPTSK